MWEYNYTSYPDELYHYGVMGMKWGVRKERPTSGNGRGRKKLTAEQRSRLKKIAIGAGVAAGVTGAAALGAVAGRQLRTVGGFKGLKAARQGYKALNPAAKRIGLNKLGLDAALRKQSAYSSYRNAPGAALTALNNRRAAQRALDPVRGAKARRLADQETLANLMANGRESAVLRRGNQAIRATQSAQRSAVRNSQRETKQAIKEGLNIQKQNARKVSYKAANTTSSGAKLRLRKKYYRG